MNRRKLLKAGLALPALSLPIPSFAFRETAEQIAGFWPDDVVLSKDANQVSVVNAVSVMRQSLRPDGRLASIWHVQNDHMTASDYPLPPWDKQEIRVIMRYWDDGVAREKCWAPNFIGYIGRNVHYPECRIYHPINEWDAPFCDCGKNPDFPSNIEVNAELCRRLKIKKSDGLDELFAAERRIIERRLTSR